MRKSVAGNYARALADVAEEQGELKRVRSELESFAQTTAEVSLLRDTLANPALPFAAKRKIVEGVAAKLGFMPIVLNFILVLLRNARIEGLQEVVEALRLEIDRRHGVHRAVVHSAAALSESDRSRLQESVQRLTGGEVRFEYHLDESLIGGLKVRLGSTVYDGSVRSQLSRIRRLIASGA